MSSEENMKFKCNFCDEILSAGFDSENMLHCQQCHLVWDGYAQCPCGMDYVSSDESSNESPEKSENDSTLLEKN